MPGSAPANDSDPAPAGPPRRPGRGRPSTIASEHLLQVAREVFLERGFRATTSEVASRAGVAEGTLFHRFGNKEALFRSAMQLSEEAVPERLIEAVDAVADLELPDALESLAVALLEIGRVALPLMMMSWSNPAPSDGGDENALRFRRFARHLGAFFEGQAAAGRIRPVDSEILARTFLGAIHQYCLSRIMSPDATWIVPQGMFVRGLVDLIMNGVRPRDGSHEPKSSPQLRGD